MSKAHGGTERVYGIDGDKVGGAIDAYFIRNEIDVLGEFSAKVASAMEEIKEAVIQSNGTVVFCAGDSILFLGNFEDQWCEKILHLFLTITGRTASMGVGYTATEAYLALKLAKADGGGKVIKYSSVK
jgi:hypothetical protein